MGNKWSGRRHNSTAAKDTEGKAQTGWRNSKTSTSLSPTDAVNNISLSVSQPHSNISVDGDKDDQLTKGITIYRSYSNVAPPEAEAELRPSSAGVRFESLPLHGKSVATLGHVQRSINSVEYL